MAQLQIDIVQPVHFVVSSYTYFLNTIVYFLQEIVYPRHQADEAQMHCANSSPKAGLLVAFPPILKSFDAFFGGPKGCQEAIDEARTKNRNAVVKEKRRHLRTKGSHSR